MDDQIPLGDLFTKVDVGPEVVDFSANRQAGLVRLNKFVSRAGKTFAARRNHEFGAVSLKFCQEVRGTGEILLLLVFGHFVPSSIHLAQPWVTIQL